MMPITEKSISIEGTIFADRREQSRHRVYKGGRLVFNRGYGVMDCVVRNLSEHGARLGMGDTTGVPVLFDLQIAGEDRPRQARVRWRTPAEIGITFV